MPLLFHRANPSAKTFRFAFGRFAFGGRCRLGLNLLSAALALCASTSARSAPNSPAAVVVMGDLSTKGVVEAARAQSPALWRLESLKGDGGLPSPNPASDIERLGQAYLEADFLRCLTELNKASLSFDRLLERGRRTDAARVGTYAAACALGAGDEGRARELVRRLLVRELDDPNLLRRTTPTFQRLAEDERQKALRWGRVTLAVRTEPEAASIQVDGVVRCPASPCRLHLLRGEHVIVAEKMGRRPRAVAILLEEDQTLSLALEVASAEEARHQLAAALATGNDPSCVEMARTASTALGVGLVVFAWEKAGQVHANVFERRGDTLTHVALKAEPGAVARVVSAALSESRLGSARRARWHQALFWSAAFGVALASAVVMFLLSRPRARTRRGGHDIAFR